MAGRATGRLLYFPEGTFTMNMPSVIFPNLKFWELRDFTIPCFDKLKCVGIFHETPWSTALHEDAIWDGVSDW